MFLYIVSCLFLNFAIAQSGNKDKPIIKSIDCYQVFDGKAHHYKTKYYNKKGQHIKSLRYKSSGNVTATYTYHENGKVAKYISKNAAGVIDYTAESIYKGDLKIESRITLEGGRMEKELMTYNEQGDLIQRKEIDIDGTVKEIETIDYKYDPTTGRKLISELSEEKKGKKVLTEQTFYAYDDKGQIEGIILKTIYMGTIYKAFTYHENGKMKQKVAVSFDNTERVVTNYNEAEERESEFIYRRKTKEDKYEFVQMNSWSYNQHGDLIGKKSKLGKKIVRAEEFKITYYEK